MRETKAQIMEGVEHTTATLVANNTVEYIRPNGVRVIRLRHTDILEFPDTDTVILNSGGWKTATTKDRMNAYQDQVVVIQNKGLWHIAPTNDCWNKNKWTPFFDGAVIRHGMVVNTKKQKPRQEEKILKQIAAYCKALRNLDKIPMPEGGDCWFCSMRTTDGKTIGDAFDDKDHLLNHLKEKYIHGSLLFNALKEHGYADPYFILQGDHRESIILAVRRYFKRHLGLAT